MAEQTSATEPALRPKFISHGTLGSKDLDATRIFYTEFLGLEAVRTSPISLMVRLGGAHVYAVVQDKNKPAMHRLFHNGLDVETDAEVDRSYEAVLAGQEKWGLHKITRPIVQHGTYSFHFWDADDNCWEILSNPPGGYTWIFDQGDQDGRGHLDRAFRESGG